MKFFIVLSVLMVALYSAESRSPMNDGRVEKERDVDQTLVDLQKNVQGFINNIEKLLSTPNLEIVFNRTMELGDEAMENTNSMVNQTVYMVRIHYFSTDDDHEIVNPFFSSQFPRQYSELHNLMMQIKKEVHELYQDVMNGKIAPNEIAAQLKLKLDHLYPRFVEAIKSTFGDLTEQIERVKEKLIEVITRAYDTTNPKIQKFIEELKKYLTGQRSQTTM